MLMLQNELLRMTWSSYSLSTICLRLLHFERFIDELFKPCERLKFPVVIKNCCRGPRETARLFMSMILEAVLHLLVLKRGRRTTKQTVTEFTIFVSLITVVTKMITFKVSSKWSAQDAWQICRWTFSLSDFSLTLDSANFDCFSLVPAKDHLSLHETTFD